MLYETGRNGRNEGPPRNRSVVTSRANRQAAQLGKVVWLLYFFHVFNRDAVLSLSVKDASPPSTNVEPAEPEADHTAAAEAHATESKEMSQRIAFLEGDVTTLRRRQLLDRTSA
jgi:hypothetical protein